MNKRQVQKQVRVKRRNLKKWGFKNNVLINILKELAEEFKSD